MPSILKHIQGEKYMVDYRRQAQPILGFVYTVTDKGHYLLLRSGADLPQLEQQVLIRVDGRTTREQMLMEMEHVSARELDTALESALQRELIVKSHIRLPEDTNLDFTCNSDRSAASPAAGNTNDNPHRLEAVRGAVALEQRGYYIGIGKRALSPLPPRNGRDYSVLIVEDDPMTAKLLKLLLDSEGFGVRLAGNKDEIQEELSKAPLPDLILLDVLLPDADGFQLLSKIRAHAVLAEIPVVMLTGRASREDVQQGLESGAAGYITKPFDMDKVVDIVRSVLGNQS
jgi:two-component system OmpR family response regulator